MRVCVLTAGLIRDSVASNVRPGKASTCRVSACPIRIHGAIRSGMSALALSGLTRTTVMTGACAFTSSPSDTVRFWT